ncbi:hypothetical protein A1O3_03518 [Capronia epimyces CBS 606.96]|uniref:Rhodopsin domain-containing protein n=1 Tax=Capronia epimyces CBS 606.96 TaxID=1182542 RepID=W9YA89_9EURO|nr:uncharacterized protein A1O3_03518 [Capronia epimyces CBS 606.96]EXJ86565.1 hypothetical protein A1O3_03518 [Capronia epimyces CBS 606.96]
MTTMCLAMVTVLGSKLIVRKRLVWADCILIAAMVCSVGFTIAINSQVSHGLGSKLSTVSADDYDGFQKAEYAWNILYIISLSLGKGSTLSLLLALAPSKSYRIPMLAVGSVVGLWTLTSILGSAFQCELPHPYLVTTGKCFGQNGFWIATGVVDIVTDVALMALPTYLVYNLQLQKQKKMAVCFAFSFRTGAIGCTIWRLCGLHFLFDHTSDVTLHSWLPTVATILEVFWCVFAACVPHLRPFIDSIQAGYLSGMIHESDGRFDYGNDSYLMGKMAQSKAASQVRSQALKSAAETNVDGGADRHRATESSLDLPRQGLGAGIGHAITSSNRVVTNTVAGRKAERDSHNPGPVKIRSRSESTRSDGAGSQGSDGSKAMIIKTTKEWSVSYQDA